MFKDYYLILSICRNATQEEIEKAYKNAYDRYSMAMYSPQEFQDIQEAFSILSVPELRAIYDKELKAFNILGNSNYYKVKDPQLASAINAFQQPELIKPDKSTGCGEKMGIGCICVIIFFILDAIMLALKAKHFIP